MYYFGKVGDEVYFVILPHHGEEAEQDEVESEPSIGDVEGIPGGGAAGIF